MALHMCSLYRKRRCVAWMEWSASWPRADSAWGSDYRRRVRTGSANLVLYIQIAAYLRNAQERAGSSKWQWYAERSKANRGLDLQPSVSGEVS